MNETSVEFLVAAEMVERIKPMTMIQMGVTSKHLTVQILYVCFKVFRKARGFTNPIMARES